MGTLGNGLPDLPPEWGEVVIPDDLTALDEEARDVRQQLEREARQLRRSQRRTRWRQRLHLPERIDDPESPSLIMPLLVVGLAVVIALLSLFMMAWPNLLSHQPTQIDPGRPVIQPGGASAQPASRTPVPASTDPSSR